MNLRHLSVLLVVCAGCTRQTESDVSQHDETDKNHEESSWSDSKEQPFAQQLKELMQLANASESRHEFVEAVETRKELLGLVEKQFGKKSWQATNARISIENTQHKIGLTKEQQKLLGEIAGLEIEAKRASDEGKLSEAVDAYARILKIAPQIWPKSSHAIAGFAFRKAEVHLAAADHSNAEPMYQYALSVQEKVLGKNHPDYAQTLNSLGVLYQQTDRHAEARQALVESADLTERIWGKDSLQFTAPLNSLGILWFEMGRLTDADYVLSQAVEIRRESLGDLHNNTADTRFNLGVVFLAKKDYKFAAEHLETAANCYEKNLGKKHPLTIQTISRLAAAYRWTNQYARAEPLLRRVVEDSESRHGPSHDVTVESMFRLGMVLSYQAKYREAEPLLSRALAEHERLHGENSPRLLPILRAYAVLLDRTNHKDESVQVVSRVQAIEARVAKRQPPNTAINR